MSLSTYADLQTAVGTWLHRSDLTAQIPDFIALAEARMNADLRARQMETITSINTTANNAFITLPSDLLRIRRLTTSDYTPLRYVTPDELQADWRTQTGTPQVFTVIGSQAQLGPVPDAVYALQLSYFQKVPALSNTNTTNWVLTNWPNVYLYGSLIAAQPYVMNDERMTMFMALYKEGVTGINAVDGYSGNTMTVRAR